jgi:hypothetical protein
LARSAETEAISTSCGHSKVAQVTKEARATLLRSHATKEARSTSPQTRWSKLAQFEQGCPSITRSSHTEQAVLSIAITFFSLTRVSEFPECPKRLSSPLHCHLVFALARVVYLLNFQQNEAGFPEGILDGAKSVLLAYLSPYSAGRPSVPSHRHHRQLFLLRPLPRPGPGLRPFLPLHPLCLQPHDSCCGLKRPPADGVHWAERRQCLRVRDENLASSCGHERDPRDRLRVAD